MGHEILRSVRKLTGVPVRVSIGATKSLTKVAAIDVKKTVASDSALIRARHDAAQMDRIFHSIDVTDF